MARERVLKVTVLGDSSSAQRAMRGLDSSSTSLGGKMGGLATKFRGAAIGVAAVGTAAFAAGKYVVDAAAEAQKVAAQTEAVLKSTGGVANVTAKEVAGLATEIMNYSGQSDEAVASAQNMLLTFTNLRNRAGENNDIFTQATKITTDLSVAMGKDLNSAALMVGKALNDPKRGITALSRAGVQFNDKQKAVIERLVDTGKTAEAQRMILKELRKEFGGSAKAAGETFAGKLDILREKFGNVAEKIGNALLPHLTKFADWLIKNLPGIVKTAQNILGPLAQAFMRIARFVAACVNAIQDLLSILDRALGPIDEFISKASKLPNVGGSIRDALSGVPGIGGLVNLGDLPERGFGGNLVPNRPTLVGERGPEIVESRSGGRVIKNRALASGLTLNNQTVINIDGKRIERARQRRQILLNGA